MSLNFALLVTGPAYGTRDGQHGLSFCPESGRAGTPLVPPLLLSGGCAMPMASIRQPADETDLVALCGELAIRCGHPYRYYWLRAHAPWRIWMSGGQREMGRGAFQSGSTILPERPSVRLAEAALTAGIARSVLGDKMTKNSVYLTGVVPMVWRAVGRGWMPAGHLCMTESPGTLSGGDGVVCNW